jgi:hypothetical protein
VLTIDELRKYDKWIGESPSSILKSVKKAEGWDKVFPDTGLFPLWASRVRQYFNDPPRFLTRVSSSDAALLRTLVKLDKKSLKRHGTLTEWGFTDVVYLDEHKRVWVQMTLGSTIYHFDAGWSEALPKASSRIAQQSVPDLGMMSSHAAKYMQMVSDGIRTAKKVEEGYIAVKTTVLGSPVIKMVSPDWTNGSLEVCLYNKKYPLGIVGKEGQPVSVINEIVAEEPYAGSYNYSETGILGLDAHRFRDVEPHTKTKGFYLNVDTTPIAERRFPRTDKEGRSVGDSKRADWGI